MSLRFGLALLLLVALSQLLPQSEGRKKLCGDALNDALDLICVHGFSRKIRRDVGEEQPLLRLWHTMALQRQLDQIEQRQNSETANEASAGQELRRPRRRIAHECCRQGCSYDDIMEYCA